MGPEGAGRRRWRTARIGGGAPCCPARMPRASLDGARRCFVSHDAAGHEVGRAGRVACGRGGRPRWAGRRVALELSCRRSRPSRAVPGSEPLPQYPAVERDLALLVPHDVRPPACWRPSGAAGGALLGDVALFDLYRGRGSPAGRRSLAYALRFQSPERTLKDEEVDRAVQDRGAPEGGAGCRTPRDSAGQPERRRSRRWSSAVGTPARGSLERLRTEVADGRGDARRAGGSSRASPR